VISFLLRLLKFVRQADLTAIVTVALWIVFFPALWLYARCYPRIPDRVLFWSNEGFRVAPTRIRCYGFAREMKKLGVDCQVLSFWDHLAHYKGLIPFETSLGYRARLTLRAMTAAVRTRAGIIVFQRPFYEFMSLTSLKILYPFGLRIWLDVDDWILDEPLTPPPSNITFRSMLPLYSAISEGCTVSSIRLDHEMRHHFKRTELIPTFPDSHLFTKSEPQDRPDGQVVFSWTGTLFMEQVSRDVLFLVEALESLKDSRAIFSIVGSGRYLEETRRKAHQLARHVRVVFPGWLEPNTVPGYLHSIDVGLYCLRTENVFCASKSPTKLFEYMACGKPSVCTNFGEAPRFVEHGVTGFIACDRDELARYCGILINDPELRRTVGENARRKIETDYNLTAAAAILRSTLFDGRQ
jgi:glycosyltransferase involved in cell wall biosynthesis